MSRRSEAQEISKIRTHAENLRRVSDQELIDLATHIRERVFHEPNSRSQSNVREIRSAAFSLSVEAIRRVLGFEIYDNQILTALSLADGAIAEMQTGEGKTLSAVPVAVLMGMFGQGVHVATPNDYLARRDAEQLSPVFEAIGMSLGHVPEGKDASPELKRQAYECDVTYATGYEIGFDFLREQIRQQSERQRPIGDQLMASLTQHPNFYGQESPSETAGAVYRGHAYCLIDEADHVLIDDALSPLVLASQPAGEASDADAVRLAMKIADQLQLGEHFSLANSGQIGLTEAGQRWVYDPHIQIPADQLIRPWHVYLTQALAARYAFTRDVHYVVRDRTLKIVDGSTGRIFEDRTWQSGLHQAIEAKEGLPVSPESKILAQITRQNFFRRYQHLCGMTGTAANCRQEFLSIYDSPVRIIPLRQPSRRQTMPLRAFASKEQKLEAIAGSIAVFHNQGRPVLVGTRSISDSLAISSQLESRQLPFQLLNGLQHREEAEIVRLAGCKSAITIATNLAGRGTDIKIPDDAKQLGGLHVIVAECHESARVDRQLIGRCARQGDPGSTQSFVSAEDLLLASYSPWLAKTIRTISVGGEVPIELETQVRKAQTNAERLNYAKRLELFRAAQREEALLH